MLLRFSLLPLAESALRLFAASIAQALFATPSASAAILGFQLIHKVCRLTCSASDGGDERL